MDTATAPNESDSYPFDRDRTDEERRLITQARLIDPLTEPLLREAGIGPGMHVVDLGAGAGDTALLASRLVGPSGSVLGLDRSAESVALARRRVGETGVTNVSFREADVNDLDELLGGHCGIDAVIGRLILMWVPDPAAVIRACANALSPGALICFVETDFQHAFSQPRTPLWDRVQAWLQAGIEGAGAQWRMAPQLHRAFTDAGLPAPQVGSRSRVAGPDGAPAWLLVNAIRGFLPSMESLGIATAAEVDIDTLEARMLAELAAGQAVMHLPAFTAAWARVPDRPATAT